MSGGWLYFQEDWAFNHKVTFDGANRLIIVGANVSEIDIKRTYSSWKEWISLSDNAKFLPAIRVTGGDPVGGGEFTGDVYFLINNWRILINHSCDFIGVIYSDNFPSPFIRSVGTHIVTNKVSSLVNTVTGGGGAGGTSATEIWNHPNRTLTATPNYNGPTVNQIAIALRAELTPELTHLMMIQNNPGLTTAQAGMLIEMYDLLGLDPTKPLIVTDSSRTAGTISQTITSTPSGTVVTRV